MIQLTQLRSWLECTAVSCQAMSDNGHCRLTCQRIAVAYSVQQMHTARQLEYCLIEIGSIHFKMQIKENGLFYLVIKLIDVVVKCDDKWFGAE